MHVEPVMCTRALQIPQLLLASPTTDLVLKGPEIEESLRCREQQGPQENDGHPSPLPNQEDRYSGQRAPAAGDCPWGQSQSHAMSSGLSGAGEGCYPGQM